jgi:RHS repeat-associated protein
MLRWSGISQVLAIILCSLLLLPADSAAKAGAGVTYDYDAFGNLIHSTGSTPNNYLFAGEQFDPDLGLYYNRARYLNTSTGRFWTMDNYPVNPADPQSLHRYLYVHDDPVGAFDPTGNDFVDEEAEATEEIEIQAQNANQVQQVLNGIERATEAEASGVGPTIASFVASAIGFVTAAAATALMGRVKAEQAKQGCNCDVVFHYTGVYSAAEIYDSQIMFTSRGITSRGLPSGAYATDIAPWEISYTQMDLKRILYFSPQRQQSQDVRAFVALCNDVAPGFHSIPNQPHQFVKEGSYPGFVGVHAVTWGLNLMRAGQQ